MTDLEITRRAIVLLAAGNLASPWYNHEAEVSACIPLAMQALAEVIAADPARYGLLMQDYSVDVSSGQGSLLTPLGSVTGVAADILWQSITQGLVKDADGNQLHYIPDQFTFEGILLSGYNYYTI